MLRIRKVSEGAYEVIITDREGEVLLIKEVTSSAEGMAFLSHLASTLSEGYREGIIKEGF